MENHAVPAPLNSPPTRVQPLFSHPRVFRVGDLSYLAGPARASGFAELDRELPGGGWPQAGLVEIGCDLSGVGELSLLMPALAAAGGSDTPMLWVLPDSRPWIPYAPGLAAAGLDLSRLSILRTRENEDSLWAAEQALRSGACGTVLLWLCGSFCSPLHLRRLQQAAMSGQAAVFAMRPLAALTNPSPAVLRIGLHAEAAGHLRLELLKRRGLPDYKSLLLKPRALPCLMREPAREPVKKPIAGGQTDRWLRGLLSASPAVITQTQHSTQ